MAYARLVSSRPACPRSGLRLHRCPGPKSASRSGPDLPVTLEPHSIGPRDSATLLPIRPCRSGPFYRSGAGTAKRVATGTAPVSTGGAPPRELGALDAHSRRVYPFLDGTFACLASPPWFAPLQGRLAEQATGALEGASPPVAKPAPLITLPWSCAHRRRRQRIAMSILAPIRAAS